MGTRVVHSIPRHTGRERLLLVGEVRDSTCKLSAYFSLPDFLPHLRGLDKLVLTVVHHPGNSYLECVVWGSLGGGTDSAMLPQNRHGYLLGQSQLLKKGRKAGVCGRQMRHLGNGGEVAPSVHAVCLEGSMETPWPEPQVCVQEPWGGASSERAHSVQTCLGWQYTCLTAI